MTMRLVGAALVLALCGCSSMYYATMESFGVEKREILVDRVREGRNQQEQAGEQFQSALGAFKELTGAKDSELEATYDRLKAELDRSEARARAVRTQIDSIDKVATALFDEWEAELDDYADPSLRVRSDDMLEQTREGYAAMLAAMQKAEASMEPVLVVFRDQVTFLKHSVNAQYVAALQGLVIDLEADVESLVADLRASIAEADAFIANMG